jgi:hypothetical protein
MNPKKEEKPKPKPLLKNSILLIFVSVISALTTGIISEIELRPYRVVSIESQVNISASSIESEGNISTGNIESQVNIINTGSIEPVEGGLDGFVLFVHVGKAGGATFYRSLHACGLDDYRDCFLQRLKKRKESLKCRMRYGASDKRCPKAIRNETMLSKHTLGRFHITPKTSEIYSKKERKWLLDNTSIFIYSVRDPIDRLISAFNYHRKTETSKQTKKTFYKKCFPSIDELAEMLRQTGSDDKTKECRKYGLRLLMGTYPNKRQYDRDLGHIKCGYRCYFKDSLDKRPNHAAAVVRTEYLWEDMVHLDRLVGGDGHWSHNYMAAETHGSKIRTYSSDLNPEQLRFLCCVLYDDMDAYQTLIIKAVNLNDSQKRESVLDMMGHCQIDMSKTDVLETPFPWYSFYNSTCKSSVDEAMAFSQVR